MKPKIILAFGLNQGVLITPKNKLIEPSFDHKFFVKTRQKMVAGFKFKILDLLQFGCRKFIIYLFIN